MMRAGTIKHLAVALAVIAFWLPQSVVAAVPTDQPPTVIDVALTDDGLLLGQVVDPQGLVKAKSPVSLYSGGRELGAARTDANGYFVFSGLRGGVYQVTAAEGLGTYRLWAPGTAPPAAKPAALLVAGTEVTRGMYDYLCLGERARFFLSRPCVRLALVGGIVGGTVAGVIGSSCQGGPFTPP